MNHNLRFPTILETFTALTIYCIMIENYFAAWAVAILALAWSQYHEEVITETICPKCGSPMFIPKMHDFENGTILWVCTKSECGHRYEEY